MIETGYDIIYLSACALTSARPSTERLASLDMEKLFNLCQRHSLTALVAYALESGGAVERKFIEAKSKAIRKNILLDSERGKLTAFFEAKGIKNMPLKGVILKDMYPSVGMRQMADNDILFDIAYRASVRDYFTGELYTVEHYGESNHDVYMKEPVYNYEIHVSLYGENHSELCNSYYSDVWERLVPDRDKKFGYHFSDEDFYIYFLSHGFKHFDGSGTGLRFLFDLYVYLEKKKDTLDFKYIKQELEKLELVEFERDCRELVYAVFADISAFSEEKLSKEQKEMLKYFITSGTYGTISNRVAKGVKKEGRLKYLLKRAFPSTKILSVYHPVFRHKILMPIGWVYRALKILFSKFPTVKREIGLVFKTKK